MQQKFACLGSTTQVMCHFTLILIFLRLELRSIKDNNVEFAGEKLHFRQHKQ